MKDQDYAEEVGVNSASAVDSCIATRINHTTRVPPLTVWNNSLEDQDADRVALVHRPLQANAADDNDSNSAFERRNGYSNRNMLLDDEGDGFDRSLFWSIPPDEHTQQRFILDAKSAEPFSLVRSLPSTSLLMKKLGHVLAVSSSAIFLLFVFPLLLHSAITDAKKGQTDFAAFYSAAGFCVITLVLSIREILSHLYNWYAPGEMHSFASLCWVLLCSTAWTYFHFCYRRTKVCCPYSVHGPIVQCAKLVIFEISRTSASVH